MLTSATPGKAPILSAEHGGGTGYRQVDCQSCHRTVHSSGYRNGGECAYCHGGNGAPPRSIGHADQGCREAGCHETDNPHDLSAFSLPNDCRGCHHYEHNANSDDCTHEEEYEVIIIGAGGGGLGAAAVLAQAGKNILLVEQSYKTGGAMVNFNRNDYRFEASLHATDGLTMPLALNALGIQDEISLLAGETMYKAVFPDYEIVIPADAGRYRAKLKADFPNESEEIDKLFDSFRDAFLSTQYADFRGKTASQALQDLGITEDRLFMVFTSLSVFAAGGPNELPAGLFAAMWGSYHLTGYNYPEGGSQAITSLVTKTILDNFGSIKLHTYVDKITVDDGVATGVRTRDGGCYTAPYIISNVNLPDTYLKLVGKEHLAPSFVSELEAREPAPGTTTIFLGVDGDYTHLFPGNCHEIFVFNGYDRDAMDLATGDCDLSKQGFAITNYSALDKTAAPPGKNVIAVTMATGYECHDEWNWRGDYDDYNNVKRQLIGELLPRLEEYLPDISAKIEVLEVASPQTVEAYTMNPRGSWEDFDDIPTEIGDNPMDILVDKYHLTPIQNLFVTGAWATEGAQALVLNSGIYAAKMLLRMEASE